MLVTTTRRSQGKLPPVFVTKTKQIDFADSGDAFAFRPRSNRQNIWSRQQTTRQHQETLRTGCRPYVFAHPHPFLCRGVPAFLTALSQRRLRRSGWLACLASRLIFSAADFQRHPANTQRRPKPQHRSFQRSVCATANISTIPTRWVSR